MDIDEIFKRPPLPKGAATTNKRKYEMPAVPSVEESLAKVARTEGPHPTGNGERTAAVLEDVDDVANDEDEERDESDATNFAPGGDADYFQEEDEDGRFFGGGLSDVQKQVLNIMDHGKDNGALVDGELTQQSVKRTILNLEKAINKNREMRTRFPTEPEKFVDSEFALTEALTSLLLLSSNPPLSYPLLISLSTPASLCDLFTHENPDIVIQVVEVLEDWTDEEVLDVDESEVTLEMEQERERRRDAMKLLLDAFVQAGIVDVVVTALERLDEQEESERAGVFHILGLLENLVSLLPTLATNLLAPSSPLLSFLFKRIAQEKRPPEFDQNRFYAAEVLAILVGLEVDGVREARDRVAKQGGTDILLKVLSVYRKRDPSSSDEVEFMENSFDALCTLLTSSSSVREAFLEDEGVELMCLMLKEKRVNIRVRAIKTLDCALTGISVTAEKAAERFVDCLGLKYLGAVFMGKIKGKKNKSVTTFEDFQHVLSLFASLFTSLPSDSPSRIRLLSKFVENDYEKVDRLLEVREDVEDRVEAEDDDEEDDDEDVDEDDEEMRYIKRLGKGLFSLQLVDYCIAWLCMEDDGVREHIQMLLDRRSKSLADVMRVLIEYHDNIGDDDNGGGGGKDSNNEGRESEEDEGQSKDDSERPVSLSAGEEQRAILNELLMYIHGLINEEQ